VRHSATHQQRWEASQHGRGPVNGRGAREMVSRDVTRRPAAPRGQAPRSWQRPPR
jgi:hypothetical protein